MGAMLRARARRRRRRQRARTAEEAVILDSNAVGLRSRSWRKASSRSADVLSWFLHSLQLHWSHIWPAAKHWQ